MQTNKRRIEARSAKDRAMVMFASDPLITGIGLGRTADGSDYAVVVMVTDRHALTTLPKKLGTVPVVGVLSGASRAY